MALVPAPLTQRSTTACSTPDGDGTCGDITGACNGFFVAGYCPGPSSFQCCVPSEPDSEDTGNDGDDGVDVGDNVEDGVVPDEEVKNELEEEFGDAPEAAPEAENVEVKRAAAAVPKKKTKCQLIYYYAAKWLGWPYIWGGGSYSGPTKGGFDCSGLTMHAVYKATGKKLPHKAQKQYTSRKCKHVPLSQRKQGDLVFWGTNGNCKSAIKHVAIVKNKQKIINAPRKGKPVRVQNHWEKSGGLKICASAVR
ncbi:hypothetical protein H2199_000002 [Coniosporium tulheliwenetii]|uniref:Uncharacterized protein n=1 Tax=Coniosporium tulheliwenetii TaxID=3383036 RepID=A0ACC2ZNN8_9PEZI|nr:hypothetical protein H2199_000002 [Cladosporium sp. JES 115]